jgi:HAD superfamily hydrolase (TIGR01509 family)
MPPRAVFLDFDGVIADTENIHITAWQRTLAALGWEVADDVCARAVEVDDRDFLAELFNDRQIVNGDVEGWVLRKQQLTVSLLRESPRLYPGVVELVQGLTGRVRLGVVTTTWRENVAAVLEQAGMAQAFELIVGKEDVRAVKPDPECYRLAIARLGIEPQEAIALEDSASGLAAARGAGLATLAIGHRIPQGDWVGSSPFVEGLAEVSKVLALLGLA